MTAPVFNLDPCVNLSSFQREQLQAVTARADFAHFVLINGSVEQTFARSTPGPINALWYDTAQDLNLTRIGVTKVLRHTKTAAKPSPGH